MCGCPLSPVAEASVSFPGSDSGERRTARLLVERSDRALRYRRLQAQENTVSESDRLLPVCRTVPFEATY